jgi:hypothetical protein
MVGKININIFKGAGASVKNKTENKLTSAPKQEVSSHRIPLEQGYSNQNSKREVPSHCRREKKL